MTNPDYRALCAELADDLELCDWPYKLKDTIRADIERARALLAAPEGTDGEVPRIGHILRLAEIIREVDGKHDKGAAALAEAILSHPGIRSAGLTAALAEPEAEGPTDEQLSDIADETPWRGSPRHFGREVARATLARWGRPAAAPVPEPGEVGGIAEWLNSRGRMADLGTRDWYFRAATLLQQQAAPAPAPVPVSERLPGDALCWWYEPDEDDDGSGYGGNWTLLRIRGGVSYYTHWLPANALPLPAPEGGEVSR